MTVKIYPLAAYKELPAPSWLIPDFIKKGDVMAISGAPGAGKTSWLFWLLLQAAKGQEVPGFGTPPKPIKTLVIGHDMSLAGYQDTGCRLLNGLEYQPLDEVLLAHGGEGLDAPPESVKTADVIVVDTYNACLGNFDENDSYSWAALKPILFGWRDSGKAVVVIHHPSKKPPTITPDTPFSLVMRGHSAIAGAIEEGYYLAAAAPQGKHEGARSRNLTLHHMRTRGYSGRQQRRYFTHWNDTRLHFSFSGYGSASKAQSKLEAQITQLLADSSFGEFVESLEIGKKYATKLQWGPVATKHGVPMRALLEAVRHTYDLKAATCYMSGQHVGGYKIVGEVD